MPPPRHCYSEWTLILRTTWRFGGLGCCRLPTAHCSCTSTEGGLELSRLGARPGQADPGYGGRLGHEVGWPECSHGGEREQGGGTWVSRPIPLTYNFCPQQPLKGHAVLASSRAWVPATGPCSSPTLAGVHWALMGLGLSLCFCQPWATLHVK